MIRRERDKRGLPGKLSGKMDKNVIERAIDWNEDWKVGGLFPCDDQGFFEVFPPFDVYRELSADPAAQREERRRHSAL
jgi:hypothetical protein